MILYHGSDIKIVKPDVLHSRISVDFGRGFYTTPIKEQAENWCKRFKRRGRNGVLSMYTLDETVFMNERVLEFKDYNEEWLNFVLTCRNRNDTSEYDLVIGGVANDKVFNTVELYFDGLIDKKEAIHRLKYEKPNLQVCFRTQMVIDQYLHYKRSEQI